MRWNSFTFASMRHGSCGTSGVSTETIRLLVRSVAWPMCFMSMPAPLSCGAANRRGAAAKPAPRPRVFLRKSRLFFMVLPRQELADPTVPRNSTDIESKRDAWPSNRREVAAVAIRSLEGGSETQMRSMEKGAACAGGRTGGPLSNPQASVKLTARNAVVVPRTTTLRRTTVT
jgi:hypothetical protein